MNINKDIKTAGLLMNDQLPIQAIYSVCALQLKFR